MEYKISGTNWLCVRAPNGNWLPVFKLTQDQIDTLSEVSEYIIKELTQT